MGSNDRTRGQQADGKQEDIGRDMGLEGTIPVVGVGGSAGALPALRNFFSTMPPNPGMAFVVVVHLAPDHDSILADLLQEVTSLKVIKVTRTEKIEVDTVYVIAPGKTLRSMDGHVVLADLAATPSKHVVVDLFFRTLADTHGANAVAVVLSGADGDGSIGIKRIKEHGGLTIAQDPKEAEHDAMPRSAIATGMVDWVLLVGQMPARVLAYRNRLPLLKVSQDDDVGVDSAETASMTDEDSLKEVLAFLRGRTGRNFTHYKRSTILRRVARRMQVNDVESLDDYLDVLRTRAGETGALSQDLLISVTNFFRDPECFVALQQRIPALFEGKRASDTVRVWVVACATGEEAYSVAMLLSEYAATLDAPPAIQVFATDLDQDAIRVAREGLYSPAIETDVSEDRLKRFFVKEPHGLRVRRELRETILFAVHDALKDSPFSRLDLVTCRNLMIYLTRQAQTRLLDTFNFSLLANATLYLGSSETVEDGHSQFLVLDKKHRLYSKRFSLKTAIPVTERSVTSNVQSDVHKLAPVSPVSASPSFSRGLVLPALNGKLDGSTSSWGEMHLKLIELLASPSILIDSNHQLIHLSRSAAPFLQYSGGEPSRDILRVIHPSLRIELRAALFQAAQSGMSISVNAMSVELNGRRVVITMRVVPAVDLAPGLMVVFIDAVAAEHDASGADFDSEAAVTTGRVATNLDLELDRLKHHLRETVDQYEISNEEIKSSNEELQAMNEELRSASEELETSQEELQSINEELSTVNQELKSKVDQLSNANSDMQNLMDATNIATVFLDRELRITRYTPSAVALFSMIPTDLGRPLSDLRTLIEYPLLDIDAKQVLEHLVPIEREVGQSGGKWFVVRLSPYRTLEDRIAGVVITFVDITGRRNDQERLRASEQRYSTIVSEATVGVVQTDLDGRFLFANRCYQEMIGYSPEELTGRSLSEFVHPADCARNDDQFLKMKETRTSFQIEKRVLHKDGSVLWLLNSVNVLLDDTGHPDSVLVVCNDVTARKEAEDAHRESEERLRMILENARDYAIFSTDLDRKVTSWNPGAERLLGYSEHDILGQLSDRIFTGADRERGVPQREADLALEGKRTFEERQQVRKNGEIFWASGAVMVMRDPHQDVVGYVSVLRDQSETRDTRKALETGRAALQSAFDDKQAAMAALKEADVEKDRFLAVLSHELRNPLAAVHSAGELLSKNDLSETARARMAQVIARQSHSMKVLLNDLLDVSYLRMNKLILHPDHATVGDVVDLAVEAVSPMIEAAEHTLTVNVDVSDRALFVDAVRLSQVLSNLLSNSAKYTSMHGSIELTARCDDHQITFEVHDNGIGMAPESVDSMFEMFRQAPVHDTHLRGMGIGLALSRRIVELHGGVVSGSSAGLGEGSTFVVVLPLGQTGDEDRDVDGVDGASLDRPQSPRGENKVRILVVDDNADAAWLAAELLTEEGHDVRVVNDGASALALIPTFMPQTVFLDIGMPGIDGYEVARRVKAEPWGGAIKLVAVTGWGQHDDRERTRLAGFDKHLVKPVAAKELLDALLPQD